MAGKTAVTNGFQPAAEDASRDQILLETRVLAIIIFPVLIVGFILLYLMPTETGAHFAWTINPEMTPIIMGSGYLAGTYYFIRIAFGRRWSHVAVTNPAVSMFATMMMVATVLHWANFNHTQWAFYTWVTLYAAAPPIVLAIWWRNRKLDPGIEHYEGPLVPVWGRIVLGVSGAFVAVLGALMLVWPQIGIDIWPWTLSPLTARVLAGWFMLAGTASLILTWDRRWDVWRMPFETTVIWAVLVLIGIVRVWHNFDPDSLATWLFVGAVGIAVVGYSGFYAYMERLRKPAATG